MLYFHSVSCGFLYPCEPVLILIREQDKILFFLPLLFFPVLDSTLGLELLIDVTSPQRDIQFL